MGKGDGPLRWCDSFSVFGVRSARVAVSSLLFFGRLSVARDGFAYSIFALGSFALFFTGSCLDFRVLKYIF